MVSGHPFLISSCSSIRIGSAFLSSGILWSRICLSYVTLAMFTSRPGISCPWPGLIKRESVSATSTLLDPTYLTPRLYLTSCSSIRCNLAGDKLTGFFWGGILILRVCGLRWVYVYRSGLLVIVVNRLCTFSNCLLDGVELSLHVTCPCNGHLSWGGCAWDMSS